MRRMPWQKGQGGCRKLEQRDRRLTEANKCVFRPNETICCTCQQLDIDCTRVKPRGKRGPKNRYSPCFPSTCARPNGDSYVQALRSQIRSSTPAQDLATTSISPCSFETNAPEDSHELTLELIAPMPILQQIISDWFGWIHPVAPIFQHDRAPSYFAARLQPLIPSSWSALFHPYNLTRSPHVIDLSIGGRLPLSCWSSLGCRLLPSCWRSILFAFPLVLLPPSIMPEQYPRLKASARNPNR